MELDEAKREIEELGGKEQNSLRLAVSITNILPTLMAAFVAESPHVHLRQFLETASSMTTMLENGDVDLCISSKSIEGPEIEWLPLMTEEIYLVLPAGHPLAGRDSVALSELAEESFIGMNSGYPFRELTDRFCRDAGFEPKIIFELDEPDAIVGLVNQSLGITFIPASDWKSVSHLLAQRLRISDPACYRTVGLAWSKRRYMSKAAQLFKRLVIAYFEQMSSASALEQEKTVD